MENILESIKNSYSNDSVSTTTILAVITMVLILAIYEFIIYRFVSHRSFYNKSFNIAISAIPFFISMIILCLQLNIVITLGTIGALAIIRFRTAIKDPVDMLYLLWSVFIGIVCGCQLYEVGVITSVTVTILLLVLDNLKFARNPYVIIAHSEKDAEVDLTKIFNNNKAKFKFKSRNYTQKGYDYAIETTLKNIENVKEELSKNKKISKYSIIEYDADDIV